MSILTNGCRDKISDNVSDVFKKLIDLKLDVTVIKLRSSNDETVANSPGISVDAKIINNSIF